MIHFWWRSGQQASNRQQGRNIQVLPQNHPARHSLRSREVLPLFDAIFAVGFTLLAYNLPEQLMAGISGAGSLGLAITTFLLNGITVLLYWFKLRRLLVIARVVEAPQLLIILISMLTIVVLPKLSALALYYGGGQGNLISWTPAQVVNMVFLGTLFLFDGFCLLFALSLRRHRPRFAHTNAELATAIHAQRLGFMALLILAGMELLFSWFNNQYVLLVPLILLMEELIVARRFAASQRQAPATAADPSRAVFPAD
jgi:uncharacterized membrane protein